MNVQATAPGTARPGPERRSVRTHTKSHTAPVAHASTDDKNGAVLACVTQHQEQLL
jgi:hypothetical protein